MANRADGFPMRRDVLQVALAGGLQLMLACDVAGGVGPKPMDAVAAPAEIVGRFTARVALLELLCTGARPVALVNGLAVEPEPTGMGILAGIRAELAAAGYPDLPITGSLEKNMPTVSTSVTVTAVGIAEPGALRIGQAQQGDLLLVIGQPKVGAEVALGDPAIADLPAALALLGHPGVHGLIPAGSGGIRPECLVLAEESGCVAELASPGAPVLTHSAGPATCLVAAVAPSCAAEIATLVRQPVWPVGRLVRS